MPIVDRVDCFLKKHIKLSFIKKNAITNNLKYSKVQLQTGDLQNQSSTNQITSSKHLAHLLHFLINEYKIWKPRFQHNRELSL